MTVKEEMLNKLREGLPAEHIEKKQGYSYVGHTYMISQMNSIFGFDGWDFEQISPVNIVHMEEKDGKWKVICAANVRLTVRGSDFFNQTIKEEVGTCGATGKNLVDVFNTAYCGAPTYAFKRAAHWLGNQFGASLYDGSNPLHNGGEDKWGYSEPLTVDEVDMVIQSFRHDIDNAVNKKDFDSVMQKYLIDLKRLPDENRDSLREFSLAKLNTLTGKAKGNEKQ